MWLQKSSALGLLALAVTAGTCSAGTIGIPVTGVLNFGVPSTVNYFDPALGQVPAGAPNSVGPTVITAVAPIDFQYADTSHTLDADFGVGTLTITEASVGTIKGTSEWFMTFTGLSAGGAVTGAFLTSNMFPDLTLAFSADSVVVTMTDDGVGIPVSGFSATIQIVQTATPEPWTIGLMTRSSTA